MRKHSFWAQISPHHFGSWVPIYPPINSLKLNEIDTKKRLMFYSIDPRRSGSERMRI